MKIYKPGQKVITESPEYFEGARLEGEYLYPKPSGGPLHKIRVISPFSGLEIALSYYDEEVQPV